jgi:zinc D-Ala-D-Ala carboxypeptidase
MTPHFTDAELACRCGCGLLPPQSLQDRAERVRLRFGKPMRVSSGARCPDYNAKVSKTGRAGPHTKGAIDFAVAGADALRVMHLMLEEGFTGIGVSQKGAHGDRFIHGDDLPNFPGQPRPTIWSY